MHRNFIRPHGGVCLGPIFFIYNNVGHPVSNFYPSLDTLGVNGEIWHVSMVLEYGWHCCGGYRESRCDDGGRLEKRGRRSGDQISPRGALHARPGAEVAREARAGLEPAVAIQRSDQSEAHERRSAVRNCQAKCVLTMG